MLFLLLSFPPSISISLSLSLSPLSLWFSIFVILFRACFYFFICLFVVLSVCNLKCFKCNPPSSEKLFTHFLIRFSSCNYGWWVLKLSNEFNQVEDEMDQPADKYEKWPVPVPLLGSQLSYLLVDGWRFGCRWNGSSFQLSRCDYSTHARRPSTRPSASASVCVWMIC